jgi:hypothetical protein
MFLCSHLIKVMLMVALCISCVHVGVCMCYKNWMGSVQEYKRDFLLCFLIIRDVLVSFLSL